MLQFLTDVGEMPFLQSAILAGLLASVACGIVGTVVVVRRITYLASTIAHCVLGGMGFAKYMSVVHHWTWFHPLLGALSAALLAAVAIGVISFYAKDREDTILSAIWALGMAIGILFISQTPGYNEDLMSYLFGNILLVGKHDLWLMGILDLVLFFFVAACYKQLQAVAFDEEFALTRGIAVKCHFLGLLIVTAITVVLLISIVGIVLVIAMLSLPVAISAQFSRDLRQTMLWAVILNAGFTLSGLVLSYEANLPAGSLTVALAGGAYLLILFFSILRRRTSTGGRVQ